MVVKAISMMLENMNCLYRSKKKNKEHEETFAKYCNGFAATRDFWKESHEVIVSGEEPIYLLREDRSSLPEHIYVSR